MSSRPFESPPPYRPDEYKPSIYAPSQDMYGAKMASQPAYSYYPEDEVVQHFYKWSSPPGIIKIMAILIVVMCVGIFACVASTLPWDLDITGQSMGYGMGGGFSSYSPGFSGYGFGGQGMGYGFAYGGSYTDPRAAKGFILAMSAFCFICGMVIFVMSVTRTETSTTRRFYLIVTIISGIMAGLVLIATIVYIMGVNPVAQASGSSFYNQILSLCQQFYAPVTNAVFVNQYLYHYCVVEPQEAIAIVLGFLIVVAFAIIIFFAVKTRRKINNYGKSNILWKKTQHEEQGDPNVEEWVKNVSTNPEQVPAMSEYNEKVNGSVMEHRSVNGLQAYSEHSFRSHPMTETVYPMKNEAGFSPNVVYSSSSDASKKAPRKKRPGRARRSPNDNDTDYTTGGESGEELEDDDFESEYPPITSDQQRQDYKREFDANLQEYKGLQAELEEVSRSILQLDRELDEHPEGSQSYKAVADEYNRLKDIKSSADYKNKRNRCKLLKAKLNHIKGMVSDYDRGR
ncbi:occludin [Eleutherodactylus coqui]|uniref:Occludin n=1 Tax=Eleutherodactylus coqui TaxID=57060 RepID=A0A8J6FHL9_ELECQ|nr:hypothetical protein GDO78_007714 [Eleutherodactylus coqui]KAG9488057.1 hypothetical protein GDO78_007714 [Eleutherodactylus coqui]